MRKVQRLQDYPGHILHAIERIGRHLSGMGQAAFLRSELVQDAVIRNIEIIGEASNNIQRVAPEVLTLYSNIPWAEMYKMRNRVSHGYGKVDLEIIWTTIQIDLPDLQAKT